MPHLSVTACLNGKVNRAAAKAVAAQMQPDDRVPECACGTGMLRTAIAGRIPCSVAVIRNPKTLLSSHQP
ncbi:MAG: hypothetical protein II723_00690 [Oscillospiraceae bacterium]|nr:hypothetical protein [Oscillospiraceae bacterium]